VMFRQPVVHRRREQVVHATSDQLEAAHGNKSNLFFNNRNCTIP
jgi:hypothetical protein